MQESFSFTPFTQGLMAAAVPLGAFFGAIAGASLSDRLGRKRVIAMSSLVFFAGFLAIVFAPNIVVLTSARVALGLAVGLSALVVPQYLAEVAPPDIRGRVIGTFQLMIVIGILASYLGDLGLASLDAPALDQHGYRWRLMFAVGLVPALVLMFGIRRAPESPRWLALGGRSDEAGDVLRTLQPGQDAAVYDNAVAEMTAQDRQTHSEGGAKLSALFGPGLRRLTIFAMMAFLFQQFSGINALIFYAPEIFRGLNFSSVTVQLTATVGIGVVNLLSTILSLIIIDKVGRRVLFMTGFAGAAVMLALLVFVSLTSLSIGSELSLLGVFGFIFFFAIAIGPLPWIYMSELFPTELRSAGMLMAVSVNWIATFLIVLLFPVVAAELGQTATFAGFTVFCILGFFFALFFAPETRGVALEDLAEQLKAGNK